MTEREAGWREKSQRWMMTMGESAVDVTSVAIQQTTEETQETTKAGRLSSRRVVLLGAAIVMFATIGFYFIPGMIDEKATGSHLVNSIYCAVITLTT